MTIDDIINPIILMVKKNLKIGRIALATGVVGVGLAGYNYKTLSSITSYELSLDGLCYQNVLSQGDLVCESFPAVPYGTTKGLCLSPKVASSTCK